MTRRSACLLPWAVRLAAQTGGDWWPPQLLSFERDRIEPGKTGEYDVAAESFSTTITRARVSTHRLGLNPLGGEDQERYFLSGHDSFESWERGRDEWRTGPLRTELEKVVARLSELRQSRLTIAARYREELSYKTRSLSIGDVRYMLLDQHVVRWGQEEAYENDVRRMIGALDQGESRRRWYLFEALSGAPAGTRLRIETFRDLKEAEPAPEERQAIRAAFGADRAVGQRWEGTFQKRWTPEHRLLYVNPRTSYPR